MGPTLLGRNGAFQIVADLFKMLNKRNIFNSKTSYNNGTYFFIFIIWCTQLLFSLNFIWGPSLFLIDSVDSMILYHLILILLSNIFFSILGLVSSVYDTQLLVL